jgi:glycosyltransferase involved in cell wall biosynthesis
VNLVDELVKLNTTDKFVILLTKKYFEKLSFPENWKKIEANFRHYSLAEQIKIPFIIKNENPDITHFPHFNVPVLFNGKYVVTIHDMLMHKSIGFNATTLSPLLYLFKRIGYRIVFDNAVRKSKYILVPSNTVKNELISKYSLNPDKVIVTNEGVDERIAGKSGLQVSRPYFTYAGNAYPHKNLSNLIKAIKILNTKSNQMVYLAIASARNIFTQRVEKLIKREKADKYIKMLGFVPDEKLGHLYKNSVAFVFPSISEGFGLPGLEALSSGTLLLCSDIEVFREVYDGYAIYFNPKSPESIAEAMKKSILIDEVERNNRIKKSLEFVKKYSWSKMAKETLEVYAKSCDSIRQNK